MPNILNSNSTFKSRIYHLDVTELKHAFHRTIHLPKSLKNEAISCIWMTIVSGVDILAWYSSSLCWLDWLFPGGPWVSRPLDLLNRRHLLFWMECVLLGLTRTVTDGGVWHHLWVCFLMFQLRSSVVKTSVVCCQRTLSYIIRLTTWP